MTFLVAFLKMKTEMLADKFGSKSTISENTMLLLNAKN